jgi:aspartate/methionine/tyrosine aminotransferase
MTSPDPMDFFRLKPIRAARVSEISEITASAPVTDEERVNFHIGNPLQDPRLSSVFLRAVLGIDIQREDLGDAAPAAILDALGWAPCDRPKLDFLIRVIQRSSPYMPRGGYARKSPHALVKAFCAWLEQQQDPLHYDTGEQSGQREIILAAGGIQETLRVLLFSLSSYLKILPAQVLCHRCELMPAWKAIPNLVFEDLAPGPRAACQQVEEALARQPDTPTFLLLGETLDEETRRRLRQLSVERPLFFIEANDAPNHLSLAREARLVRRVIRLLTPAIFAPRLSSLSPVFVAGNSDFLKVIENVHFNLKGTPSASEVELLAFLLEQDLAHLPAPDPTDAPLPPTAFEGLAFGLDAESVLPQLAGQAEQRLERLLNDHARTLDHALAALEQRAGALSGRLEHARTGETFDEFAGLETGDLLDRLVANLHRPDWCQALERSFIDVFVRHRPQYHPASCRVASGSSRTALGILGFHCGIREVVIPDLSWSYEQCFPTIHAVPLTHDLALDAEAIIRKVEELCWQDPAWPGRGAVVINNPHNATGRIFDEKAVRRLTAYCLQHDLTMIDDLAYQNVAPVDALPLIKTVRQVAAELVREGILGERQTRRVVTVHSMSKTDCLAGARLSVVEIPDRQLMERFDAVNARIRPNLGAVFLCYLFYRSDPHVTHIHGRLRNSIFLERTRALLEAVDNLPADRNPYQISILPPAGSMYPLLRIARLPHGLSLDWLASSLARSGIGMLPLTTFARTEEGYETGRTTFRLTLGGVDAAAVLARKTRRLLIDLNRLIAEEDARYNRKRLPVRPAQGIPSALAERASAWEAVAAQVLEHCRNRRARERLEAMPPLDGERLQHDLLQDYAPERLATFRTRLLDRALVSDELLRQARSDGGKRLAGRLEQEFMKDSLPRRQELFRLRSYDRTVHPTQMYSLQTEEAFDAIVAALVARQPVPPALVERAAGELLEEYLGRNIAISSQKEADEILLDMAVLIAGEEFAELFAEAQPPTLLSFWSDWDGSNRPSGQGHRLVSAVVMRNVQRMARILDLLHQAAPDLALPPDLLAELESLPRRNQRFTGLLNAITVLTQQLERRYRGILPFSMEATPFQRLATRLHLRRDPVKVLWQHNDRYERKMLELRQRRSEMIEYYFSLNKQLRKQLHGLIPAIRSNRSSERLLREAVEYRDLLQRVVITPRIQQGMITARDQFAIDTTVYNMYEIDAIAGKYGNPGMTMAVQVSLSSKPEALIALDRKMRTQREQVRRREPSTEAPPIWLIPLFEDIDSVKRIPAYLDQVWDYATQSRQASQTPQARFAEIIPEVFIAGSDLSQQASQGTSAYLYRAAKFDFQTWLAEHGVAEAVRIKLGSGEPMQRQGGYYSPVAGLPAFLDSEDSRRRFQAHLPAAARRSTSYAVTPLQGVFLGGDLRTFQSNLSEQLRFLPAGELVGLLHHVRESQMDHRRNLVRAAETLVESRLGAQSHSLQELKRLTIGANESLLEDFLKELTENFRNILYGRPEDAVGLHAVSYFIGRAIPQLRERPTSRQTLGTGVERGQHILANIAEIVPLSRQGSLLRAIAHNQAQTAVLGINQLTTGLFRALERFAQRTFAEAEGEQMIAERLLPHLPVYEILASLRLYQDCDGEFLRRVEAAFPAGNPAFVALREDDDAMRRYLPLFQQELLRQHGINVSDFFADGSFLPNLLPTLRPDLAVLLQGDLFNTAPQALTEGVSGRVSSAWRAETARLLQLRRQVHDLRAVIWEVIGDSITQKVQSFTELAAALAAFSATRAFDAPVPVRGTRLPPALAGFVRTARADDEMRNFLIGTIEYLSTFAEGNIEIPVSIIRAMNDVERIAQLEESALPSDKQDILRCCVLQIARLAGENG